jgi:hypothetical protein
MVWQHCMPVIAVVLLETFADIPDWVPRLAWSNESESKGQA